MPGKIYFRGWEYTKCGDYHCNLDPNWSYTPTYLKRMAFVKRFIEKLPTYIRILDAGCGEGILVEEFLSTSSLAMINIFLCENVK